MHIHKLAQLLKLEGFTVLSVSESTDVEDAAVELSDTLNVNIGQDGSLFVVHQRGSLFWFGPARKTETAIIADLIGIVEGYANPQTPICFVEGAYQPHFKAMDKMQLAGWHEEQVGHDWISDVPDIGLREFQDQCQDYWEIVQSAKAE